MRDGRDERGAQRRKDGPVGSFARFAILAVESVVLKQVLIVNITRMGDLVQTGVLLHRLQQESPGVSIDLVVDSSFAPMASMLVGLRRVVAFDFHALLDESRARVKDVVTLHAEFAAWAQPLVQTKYDRVINLTFNRRSAWLVAYIQAREVRGVTVAPDGALIVRNPWMAYFTDLHRYRSYNRFNLVDLYALGGSGPGPAAAPSLAVEPAAREWAGSFLRQTGEGRDRPVLWVGVQVGASDVIKAWRPEYFGRTMATLRRRLPVGFVLIGTTNELPSVRAAMEAYRDALAADGVPVGPVRDAVGRTTLSQLVGLLGECRLLLTNDTGPMHIAVSIGTPVVDLSVGHVNFHETGPYGPGHWVIQPDLGCAPCGFDEVCPHHACKDRVLCEEVADVCQHALGQGPLPAAVHGIRVYESGLDEDGLACYRLRRGSEEVLVEWYGIFWRRFWYQAYTGQKSRLPPQEGLAPDLEATGVLFEQLSPLLEKLSSQAHELAQLSRRWPLPVSALKATQNALSDGTTHVIGLTFGSPAFWPVTVAFLRAKQGMEEFGLADMARHQTHMYQQWKRRVDEVGRAVCQQASVIV